MRYTYTNKLFTHLCKIYIFIKLQRTEGYNLLIQANSTSQWNSNIQYTKVSKLASQLAIIIVIMMPSNVQLSNFLNPTQKNNKRRRRKPRASHIRSIVIIHLTIITNSKYHGSQTYIFNMYDDTSKLLFQFKASE